MNGRLFWIISMIGSVLAAIVADNSLAEPWNHYAMLAATVCAAVTGYQVQHPPPKWDGTDRRNGI